MAEEEVEMTYDKLNYEVLAQIYTIINDKISQKTIAMEKVLEKVLEKDFDINYSVSRTTCSLPNIAGRTALDFALNKGELEIFKLLIKRGANFTDKNRNRTTVLHRIIEKSYVNNKPCYELKGKLEHPFVQSVLSAHVEWNDVANPRDQNGISHFHIACMFNHSQAVEYFLGQRVCVNQAINQDSKILPGYTPLHLSARYSAFETAKLLLDHTANFELKDAQGAYPLHLLVQRNIEILDWLNVQKQTLCDKLKDELSINEKIIELLIEKTRNKEEDISRCQVACTLQDTRILEQTMAEGTNLNDSVSGNSPFWPGYTALHFAAIFNINAVRLLLANGANVLAKDPNGVTPLNLCLQRYSPGVIHSIMSTVAELNDVRFPNTNTTLCDLVLAMSEEDSLKTFIRETMENVNVGVPFDSPVWPGYTILHIAVALSDRLYENKDPYKDTDYKQDETLDENWPYYENAEYFKRIKLCLTMGADVTITDFHNSTPLHLAFRIQNRNIVELLLEHHHKLVDVVDIGNLSHLHIACAMERIEFVEKLLQTGADVNRPVMSSLDFRFSDNDRETPEFLHVNPGLTCLHIAMATSNENVVEILIDYDADFYAKDSFEMTPIHQVLRYGYCNFGFNALSRIRFEDRVTSFGLTHLHVACFAGDLDAVEELLESGANIEEKVNYNKIRSAQAMAFLAPFDGYTPLHFALREHQLEIVKFLVRRGANFFAESTGGFIPFYEALKTPFKCNGEGGFSFVKNGYYEGFSGDDDDMSENMFALNLIDDKKIKKLIKKHSGITKLHIACLGVKTIKVEQLFNKGANPNARVHVDSPIWPGYRPLHVLMTPRFTDGDDHEYQYEIYSEIPEIGKLLLKHGARVMLKDAQGNTPIHMAPELLWSDSQITEKGLSSVGWILKGLNDFTVNPVDARGISHFEVACMTAQDKVVKKFLKQCVDINRHFGHFTDRYGGFTPLHLVSFYKTDSLVDILLNYGADPHAKDFLGNTPLHTAAVHCRLGNNGYRPDKEVIFEILLNAGADVEATNVWNEPPLAVALRMELFTYSAFYLIATNYRTCRANLFSLENEEGLLGIALRYISSYKRLEDHCFYTTIANAPILNSADEMGRTVIHNVVSVNKSLNYFWENGSIENYTKIIHAYIKLDFDIDCQDNKGQTALHKAARFGNYNAIIGLLMNGADINIVDASNKPAFAYSFERKECTEEVYRNILQVCLLHTYKLQVAGLEISDANQEIVAKIPKESITCLKKMQSCSEELERLKKYTITSSYSMTMYNFLSETSTYFRMMLFLRDTIDDIFVKNAAFLRETYPQFAGLLQMQYRNIFIRSQLLDPAKTALSILADFQVPDLCCDKIFKFLKNKDLKQVISAAELQ